MNIRSFGQEKFHGLGMTRVRGPEQSGALVSLVPNGEVGATIQKETHHFFVPAEGGPEQWRVVVIVPRIYVRASG
jgi:hypothetical protein